MLCTGDTGSPNRARPQLWAALHSTQEPRTPAVLPGAPGGSWGRPGPGPALPVLHNAGASPRTRRSGAFPPPSAQPKPSAKRPRPVRPQVQVLTQGPQLRLPAPHPAPERPHRPPRRGARRTGGIDPVPDRARTRGTTWGAGLHLGRPGTRCRPCPGPAGRSPRIRLPQTFPPGEAVGAREPVLRHVRARDGGRDKSKRDIASSSRSAGPEPARHKPPEPRSPGRPCAPRLGPPAPARTCVRSGPPLPRASHTCTPRPAPGLPLTWHRAHRRGGREPGSNAQGPARALRPSPAP
ncbi:PREDICTED: translation initiation factor IF-2-like, partial [Chinchilla lanigera]|uniref:translation initiation factor IF-2-like n=1 Tax=Chinchilla lanigera TaxID=34839 RepID=UPI000696D788